MKGDIKPELTPRELEVLRLVAQGHSYELVAFKLEVAERTVRNHMVCIRVKLNARNSIHAVAIAKDEGLI